LALSACVANRLPKSWLELFNRLEQHFANLLDNISVISNSRQCLEEVRSPRQCHIYVNSAALPTSFDLKFCYTNKTAVALVSSFNYSKSSRRTLFV